MWDILGAGLLCGLVVIALRGRHLRMCLERPRKLRRVRQPSSLQQRALRSHGASHRGVLRPWDLRITMGPWCRGGRMPDVTVPNESCSSSCGRACSFGMRHDAAEATLTCVLRCSFRWGSLKTARGHAANGRVPSSAAHLSAAPSSSSDRLWNGSTTGIPRRPRTGPRRERSRDTWVHRIEFERRHRLGRSEPRPGRSCNRLQSHTDSLALRR